MAYKERYGTILLHVPKQNLAACQTLHQPIWFRRPGEDIHPLVVQPCRQDTVLLACGGIPNNQQALIFAGWAEQEFACSDSLAVRRPLKIAH